MNLEMISAHEIQCKIYKIMADIMQWNHAMISFLKSMISSLIFKPWISYMISWFHEII
jgi:hypothetical protein